LNIPVPSIAFITGLLESYSKGIYRPFNKISQLPLVKEETKGESRQGGDGKFRE